MIRKSFQTAHSSWNAYVAEIPLEFNFWYAIKKLLIHYIAVNCVMIFSKNYG